MAKLYFKYGAMGSAKSLDLLRTAYNYEERGQEVVLMTSALDNRYGVGKIKTRVGLEREAVAITKEMNIFQYICALLCDYVVEFPIINNLKFGAILIDEANLLTKEQIYQLTDIVDRLDIPVMCWGLRSDFKGEPFEGSMYLMSLADKIEEIKTICHCGKKASINARIKDSKVIYEGEQILIGGNETYKSLCRKCWKEGRLS